MGKVTVKLSEKDGKFYWHRTVSSDIVADSGQGYLDHTEAIEQAKKNSQEGDTIVLVDPDTGEETPV